MLLERSDPFEVWTKNGEMSRFATLIQHLHMPEPV